MSGYKTRSWDGLFFYDQTISDKHKDLIRYKFANGQLQTEKLHAENLIISLKLNSGGRAICTSVNNDLVVLEILEKHEYGNSKTLQAFDYGEVSSYVNANQVYREAADSPVTIIESGDRIIALDRHQEKIILAQNKSQAVIVKGMAGTGKSTVAVQISAQSKASGKKVLFTTKSERLLNHIRQQHVQDETEAPESTGHLNFLTYQDLWKDVIFDTGVLKPWVTNYLFTKKNGNTPNLNKEQEKQVEELRQNIINLYNKKNVPDRAQSQKSLQKYLSDKLYDVKKFSSWATSQNETLITSKKASDLIKLYEDMIKVACGQTLSKKNSTTDLEQNDVVKNVLTQY